MRGGSGAGRSEAHPPRVRPCMLDETCERGCRKIARNRNRMFEMADHRNRRQVAHRQGLELPVEQRIDDDAAGRPEHHGVSIRRGAGRYIHGDIASGTGQILDHDRLAEDGRKARCARAGDHVGRTAGHERHDDAHRPRRKRLGARAARHAQQPAQKAEGLAATQAGRGEFGYRRVAHVQSWARRGGMVECWNGGPGRAHRAHSLTARRGVNQAPHRQPDKQPARPNLRNRFNRIIGQMMDHSARLTHR